MVEDIGMSRRALFSLVILLVFVLISSVSALCNGCNKKITIDLRRDLGEELTGENEQESSAVEEGSSQGLQGQQTQNDEDIAEPTIRLEIYQDATYSAEDDVCFYRIKAIVTGKPKPKIEWSKDDSGHSFGEDIAQVNLRRDQAYTLVATASNKVGAAEASIELTWGCNGEEGDYEEGDETEAAVEVPEDFIAAQQMVLDNIAAGSLTEEGWQDYFGPAIGFVGDDRRDRQSKCIISFGLHDQFDELFGAEVIDLRAIIGNISPIGDPTFGGRLDIYACHYIDFIHVCREKKTFDITADRTELEYSHQSLVDVMQYVLDNDIPQFHLIFEFTVPTDSDGIREGYRIDGSEENFIIVDYIKD